MIAVRTSADILRELLGARTRYAEARLATTARKMELTAAHERMQAAQAEEMTLTQAVEALEKALLECVRAEAEEQAEREAGEG